MTNCNSFANYSYLNPQTCYVDSAPGSELLLKKDVYTGGALKNIYANPSMNLSIQSRQEYNTRPGGHTGDKILGNLLQSNEITQLFFSKENIKRLQSKIKTTIYDQSKGKFKMEVDQDESDLIVVMRAIYLDQCKNLPGHTVRQVKILNNKVIEHIIPDMMTNIKQYYGYINDISKPITPPLRPMATTAAGRRILPSFTKFYL
jgi:hypothetical protein